MSDYPAFGKIPRFNREVVITEKIDGTNGLINVEQLFDLPDGTDVTVTRYVQYGPELYAVRAGSRNRWVTPGNDNYGFAAWARDNADELVKLGPGLHYGEWYGKGIQRGYGLDEKRFALFNVGRWDVDNKPKCCDVVPVLFRGSFMPDVDYFTEGLRYNGSVIAPGYMRPEGVIIYHTAAKQYFKVLLENDSQPKGIAA